MTTSLGHYRLGAKHLWRRLPAANKTDRQLSKAWELGQHLWRRQWEQFFTVVDSTSWAPHLELIPAALKGNAGTLPPLHAVTNARLTPFWLLHGTEAVRARIAAFIGQTFSSISLLKLGKMLGHQSEAATIAGRREAAAWCSSFQA